VLRLQTQLLNWQVLLVSKEFQVTENHVGQQLKIKEPNENAGIMIFTRICKV